MAATHIFYAAKRQSLCWTGLRRVIYHLRKNTICRNV